MMKIYAYINSVIAVKCDCCANNRTIELGSAIYLGGC